MPDITTSVLHSLFHLISFTLLEGWCCSFVLVVVIKLKILTLCQFRNTSTELEDTRGTTVVWGMKDEFDFEKLTSSHTLRKTEICTTPGSTYVVTTACCVWLCCMTSRGYIYMHCLCMSGHQYKALATDLYLEHQVIVSGWENSLNKYLLCACQIDNNWSLKYKKHV